MQNLNKNNSKQSRGVVRYIPHLKKFKFTQIWGIVLIVASVSFATDILEWPSVVGNSLGGTFYKSDPASIVLNPVSCRTIEQSCFYASYMYLDEQARYNCLVYVDRYDNLSFSILFSQIYDDNIIVKQNLTDEGFKTYASKILGMLSLGYVLPYNFVLGTSLKTVYYDIYETKSNIPLGVDFGIYKNLFSYGNLLRNMVNINAALALSNIFGPKVKIASYTEEYKLSPRLSLNFSLTMFPRYNFKKELLLYDKLSLFCDFYSQQTLQTSFGVEYNREKFFVRVGYNNNRYSKYSFGLGANFGNVSLNYSFVPFYSIGIHSIDFTYYWGEKQEIEQQTPSELEDFLQVQKKALRIAEKYIRDAEDLIKTKKYDSALELLNKIYPLSKDNKKISELIDITKNVIISTKINKIYSDFIKSNNTGDFISMYDSVLQAVDVSVDCNETKQMVEEFAKIKIPNSSIFIINDKKTLAVNNVKQKIEKYVLDHEFENALSELNKLQLISYQDFVEQKNFVDKEIKDYTTNLVKKALQMYNQNQLSAAFLLLKEAFRISKDESIKLQAEKIKEKIKTPNLYDELYQKKLFYLACIYFATEDYQNAKKTFLQLRSINPKFEFDLLEEALRKQKIVSLLEILP